MSKHSYQSLRSMENKGRRKEVRRIQIQSSIDFILSVQSALSALSALSYSVALRCISERL